MNPGLHAQLDKHSDSPSLTIRCVLVVPWMAGGWCSSATVTRCSFRQEAEITMVTLGEQLTTACCPIPGHLMWGLCFRVCVRLEC